MTVRRVLTVAIAGSLAVLAGCSAGPGPGAPDPTAVAPNASRSFGEIDSVASGLVAPWSVTFLGETALLSSRDTGEIREIVGDSTRVIGMVPGVAHRGESGLLGLTVDPEGRLYAYSTGSEENRIHRFTLTGEPGSFGLASEEIILDDIPAASYHDGGRIAFGPDGMLYATTGDAGRTERAQDPDSLGGKILRMTPDGEVPDDNPFTDSLVYSLGHRNPQGIAWDADGRLFAAEFGQDTWDELNIITPGANYGWPEVEGSAGDERYIDPVQQWSPDDASPSGIAIVGNTVYIANLRGERLRAVPVADPTTSSDYYVGEYGRLRDVQAAPDGSLWFATSNTDGRGAPDPEDDRILRVELSD